MYSFLKAIVIVIIELVRAQLRCEGFVRFDLKRVTIPRNMTRVTYQIIHNMYIHTDSFTLWRFERLELCHEIIHLGEKPNSSTPSLSALVAGDLHSSS